MVERNNHIPSKEISIYGYHVIVQSVTRNDKLTCAFLGPEGTYTQQATLELLGDIANYEMVPRNGVAVTSTDDGKFDLGLVPVENSSGGVVLETVKEIIHSRSLVVLGERVLPIHHNLYGSSEAFSSPNPIIHSHPQAIDQCSIWMTKNLPNAKIAAESSTAEAVKVAIVKNELAIASAFAGQVNGTEPLYERIENLLHNTTRFWLLGRGETEPTGNDRTALIFSFRQGVGKIAYALKVFADAGISLNRIDSFPMGALDQYYFVATIDGHTKDPKTAKHIVEFCQMCFKCKILGSYHKAPIEEKAFESSALDNGWAVAEDIDKV